MTGYKLSFYSIRSVKHDGLSVDDFLIREAKSIGIKGISVTLLYKGCDHNGVIHSAGFFELSDEALEVMIIADEVGCDKLLEKISSFGAKIFYAKSKVEFGFSA